MRGTLGIFGMSLIIFLVVCMYFSNVCAVCTLGNEWACPPFFSAFVCGVGLPDVTMALLLFTDSSVSFINFCSSSAPSLLPMFLDDFVTISYDGHNFVSMGDGGFCDFLMAELGCVREYLTIGGLNVE